MTGKNYPKAATVSPPAIKHRYVVSQAKGCLCAVDLSTVCLTPWSLKNLQRSNFLIGLGRLSHFTDTRRLREMQRAGHSTQALYNVAHWHVLML